MIASTSPRLVASCVPFQTVHTDDLPDGRRVPVNHPEAVAVGHRVALVLAPDDSAQYLDLNLVVALELDPPAPTSFQGLDPAHDRPTPES